ncbi:MAG: CidA/LrgA family protein [Rhodospirillales bacterium]
MIARMLALLLGCQLAGEVLVVALNLPVPGPVAGMVFLFVGLVIRGHLGDDLSRTANGLLGHLSLLFVPAGVGVVTHIDLVREQWLPLSAALVVSTVLTVAVTGLVMRALSPGVTEGDD